MLELGGAVVSVLDRSGREDVRLHQAHCDNTSVVDLQGYVDHTLPLSLLCITMILRVRRKFFEITTKPNTCIYGEQREQDTTIVQKRSTYKCMYGETYIVWVIGSKSACEKEIMTEKLQIDTETEMLARGTSASLSFGDDRRVVQRVKLCV